MSGFRPETRLIIEEALFARVRSESSKWGYMAKLNAKKAFYSPTFSKPPVKTGGTRDATTARTWFGNKTLRIRFYTPNPENWRQDPLRGWGTSESYGERNWLIIGAFFTFSDMLRGTRGRSSSSSTNQTYLTSK